MKCFSFGSCRIVSRREFLRHSAGCTAGCCIASVLPRNGFGHNSETRRYHLSVSIDALSNDPALLDIVCEAGITDVWPACFFHGSWGHSLEDVLAWKKRIEAKEMQVHNITVPLGHPTFTEKAPDYSANVSVTGWKAGMRPDGKRYYGVSIHTPATQANVEAVAKIKTTDPGIIFLDDDFRLAPSPADIGGCFCEVHRTAFLQRNGYRSEQWDELLDDVQARRLTPIVRSWVNDACEELTGSFRAQQEVAAPEAALGIMVMYLGSEKAGIRLTDYQNVPFRVGELMFDDESFQPVKGKTNELFSSLFHRRFVSPESAYSETTAWPPDRLSAANMAAKLAITTISDVRHTMFMSGVVPFPRTHWSTLASAMRKQRALHEQIRGNNSAGPFKHFWGEHSRWIGDANPYSLFLALGIPFEVVERPPRDGWTFLSEWDAGAAASGLLKSDGTTLVYRPGKVKLEGGLEVAERLDDLFAFKHRVISQLRDVPTIAEDIPMVCAWYPSADSVLLWNLTEQKQDVTLCYKDSRQSHSLDPLDSTVAKLTA